MAMSKLVAYWIRLRERGSDDSFWDLSNMQRHESGIYYNNIMDLFEDFCRASTRQTHIDGKNDETFRVDYFERDEDVIEGELSKGESGVSANHYNKNTNDRDFGARGVDISEEVPYYFLFRILSNTTDRALLILREYGNKGPKLITEKQLKRAIRGVTKKGIYQSKKVITEDARRAVQQADRVASLKLEGEAQLRAIDAVADNEDVEDHNRQTVNQDIHISPDGSFMPEQLRPLFDTNYRYAGFDLEEYDDAKLTIEQDDSNLTFSVFNPKVDMRMILNEDTIEFQGDHPLPSSASEMGRRFVNVIQDEYSDGTIDTEPLLTLAHRPSSDSASRNNADEADTQQTALGANGGVNQDSDRDS